MATAQETKPKRSTPLIAAGALLILLGIVGLAHPRWKVSSTKRVTHIGSAEVINETVGYRSVPAYLSIVLLIAGGGLAFLGSREF